MESIIMGNIEDYELQNWEDFSNEYSTEEIRREILFRKFTIRKRSNHFKSKPIPNFIEMVLFVPHRKIHKAIMKLDRKHQKLTDTKPKQTLKLARLEKKYSSLLFKLRRLTGNG